MNFIKRSSLYIFFGLLAYMPLHIFLSTWLGTSFGVLEAAKIAKDGVLIIGSISAFIPSVRQPWFRLLLKKDRLIQLILGYALLHVILAAVKPTDPDAELLGLVYNTRFLLFFLYAVLLTRLFDAGHLLKRSVQVVLASGLLVLVFGVLQYTLLPNDALRHVGYERANGVLPAFFIDDKPDLERVMSTLRDPNSLGSYVIILGMLAAALYIKTKDMYIKRMAGGFFALSLLCLWFTFSRSAWLGFVVGLLVLGAVKFKKIPTKNIQRYIAPAMLAVILLVVGAVAFKDSYFVQNVVFHADHSTVLEDPNELRIKFFKESAQDIAENPLGSGPGTAGLASIRNDVQGTVLNENYYLQIATEVGVIGLALFLAISTICAVRLWSLRTRIIAAGLLASLAGLAFTNLLVHIWSNEAVAYTWWALAGIVIGYSHEYGGKNGNVSRKPR